MITRIAKISTFIIVLILIVGVSAYFTLTLIIKSEDTVVVPDLVGKKVLYVLKILTDFKLNAKIKGSEYSSDIPADHVIFQEPEPGSEIKIGRDVRIIISKGAETILMPNLQGLSIRQARIILEENGLHPGKLSTIYSKNIKKEEVITQSVSHGSIITRGAHVDLLVSRGMRPKAYKMLDLKGLSLEDAIFLIEKNNLLLGEIKFYPHEDKPKNVIVSQEPLYGHQVIEGTFVNIIINRKHGRIKEQYLHAAKGASIFRYKLGDGFLKRHILVRLNSSGLLIDLFDNFAKPGEEILLIVPKNHDSTIFLYENDKLIKTQVFDSW
ncbi:MAG: PASTA domain-containing protein [Desulfobacterales bacterium]|uniref:PASTA domain-containing protein n=1 Tax=Candidatus Desulfaltia bathyphila TaxID=2841697 RepID=A0A8J6T7L1_9BACT|nr:PASTA domain-containing protein [Candidatus Desulfaltia bathyphila]MBL7195870.1 PASTA domain-containing protein [Desulfobacterales bacterium]MBL7207368.1 PASTA domain-containing protein [Desulfobacterales bacterium]